MSEQNPVTKEENESADPPVTVKTTAFGLHLEEWERKAYENKEREEAAARALLEQESESTNSDDDIINEDYSWTSMGKNPPPEPLSPNSQQELSDYLMSHHSVMSDNVDKVSDNEDDYYRKTADGTEDIIVNGVDVETIIIDDDTEEEEEEGAVGFERSSDDSDYYDVNNAQNDMQENGALPKQHKNSNTIRSNGVNFPAAAVSVDWSRQYEPQEELENNDEQYNPAAEAAQEEVQEEKVDDDEDRRNPQYIPKKGTFYEHDDRTLDDTKAPPEKKEIKPEKKRGCPSEKKWDHGGYVDELQQPKTRAEIIAQYGFDIRAEDGPPRARRRRRYGRGPNQYTRKWEDERAYGKLPAPAAGRGRGRPSTDNGSVNSTNIRRDKEEFPPLGASRTRHNSSETAATPRVSSRNSTSSSQPRRAGYSSSSSSRTSDYTPETSKTSSYASPQAKTSSYSSPQTRPNSHSSTQTKSSNYSSAPSRGNNYSSASNRANSYSSSTNRNSNPSAPVKYSNYTSSQTKNSFSSTAPSRNSVTYSAPPAKKQTETVTKSAEFVRTSTAPGRARTATVDASTSTKNPVGPTKSTVPVKSYTFNNTSNFKNASNSEASNQQLAGQNTTRVAEEHTQVSQNQDQKSRDAPEKFYKQSVVKDGSPASQDSHSEVPATNTSLNGQQSFENSGSARGILVDSIIVNPLPRGRSRSVPTQVFLPSNVPVMGRGRGIRTKHRTVAEFIGAASNALHVARMAQSFSSEKDVPEEAIIHSDALLQTDEELIADMSSLSVADQSLQYIAIDHSPRKSNQGSNYHINNERQQAVVPPRLQDVLTNRPKRYSSLRQRSPQETGLQQSYIPAQSYYTQGFMQQQVYAEPAPGANSTQLQLMTHVNVSNGAYQTSYTAGPYIQQATNIIQQPPPNMIQPPNILQQPPPSNIIQPSNLMSQTPPNMIPQTPPNLIAQTPPNMIPQNSPMIPQSTPNLISHTAQNMIPQTLPNLITQTPPNMIQSPPNIIPHNPPPFVPQNPPPTQVLTYMAGPSQTQFQAMPAQNYQPFQSYTAVPEWTEPNVCVPPPAPGQTELFRPPGGITYYSPEEQVAPRVTHKRQRSAIPIVPPPEGIQQHNEERSRGDAASGDTAEEGRNLNNTLEAGAVVHIINESPANERENSNLVIQNQITSETDNSINVSEVPLQQDM